jgi:hypothetical protein
VLPRIVPLAPAHPPIIIISRTVVHNLIRIMKAILYLVALVVEQ